MEASECQGKNGLMMLGNIQKRTSPSRLLFGNRETGQRCFEIHVPFQLFRHQWRAWMRLTSKDQQPQSTIITTGTGSGKTEYFSYPILEHC
jgi:ATP-dependent helicase YprA (DUF1998 family)